MPGAEVFCPMILGFSLTATHISSPFKVRLRRRAGFPSDATHIYGLCSKSPGLNFYLELSIFSEIEYTVLDLLFT